MRVNDAGNLGLFIRDYRILKQMSQTDLAKAAGVSRRWLANLESGKSSVELGLVLKTLEVLDLAIDVQPRQLLEPEIDLNEVIRRPGRRNG